jgi:protein ImuB
MFCCLVRDRSTSSVPQALERIAHECSPRVESYGQDAVVFDAGGLERVLGPPPAIAESVRRLADDQGLVVRLAVAETTTAAWLLAQARAGITIVPKGHEARVLSTVPLETLLTLPEAGPRPKVQGDLLSILSRWGLRSLGDLARMPRAGLHARLGPTGVRWHQAACGEEITPLVPAGESPRFVERLELEWPVENLEALSFVLARLCEDLSVSLERADRGAVTVATRLRLVTRVDYERVLHLPAPMRDPRVLRTLILLDLESHPPGAAIERVEIDVEVVPGRILQGSLLRRALPSPEHLATLVARLGALMGETRVGAPRLLDTHDERTVGMTEFLISDQGKGQRAEVKSKSELTRNRELLPFNFPLTSVLCPLPFLRRFRLPIAARVAVDHSAPVRVTPSARGLTGGRVVASAGPWRTSGRWWALDSSVWDRDEWDVELTDGGVYRLARHRATGQWEVEGVLD